MAQPMMLAFNFADERLECLRRICTKKHIRLAEMSLEDQQVSLASLCGMMAKVDATAADDSFEDEMIVMINFTPGGMDAFLLAWRQAEQPQIRLKAVLTPSNMRWTAVQLHAELAREDEAMHSKKESNNHE